MPGYISSNENRFYVCAENSYNQTPPFAGSNRIPAVSLKAQRSIDVRSRKDKTGSRTYFGTPAGSRARTTYGLTTYMTRWGDTSRPPAYGCLFEAALGGAGVVFPGASGTRASAASLTFTHPHGLCPGPSRRLRRRDSLCERGGELDLRDLERALLDSRGSRADSYGELPSSDKAKELLTARLLEPGYGGAAGRRGRRRGPVANRSE